MRRCWASGCGSSGTDQLGLLTMIIPVSLLFLTSSRRLVCLRGGCSSSKQSVLFFHFSASGSTLLRENLEEQQSASVRIWVLGFVSIIFAGRTGDKAGEEKMRRHGNDGINPLGFAANTRSFSANSQHLSSVALRSSIRIHLTCDDGPLLCPCPLLRPLSFAGSRRASLRRALPAPLSLYTGYELDE